MPSCDVPKCRNSAKQGFKMCYFPKDANRRDEWVKHIGKIDWTPKTHSAVCEVYS